MQVATADIAAALAAGRAGYGRGARMKFEQATSRRTWPAPSDGRTQTSGSSTAAGPSSTSARSWPARHHHVHLAGTRPVAQKASIVAAVTANVWPLVDAGVLRPVIHSELPMAQADEAHRIMTASTHTGKIVLHARPMA